RITWEYRALPDRDTVAIMAEVADRATAIAARYAQSAPEAAFETRIRAAYPGLKRDPNSPAIQLACALTGDNAVQAISYGTEGGLFQAAGIPSVVCGPGSIRQAHKADEFVELAQLEACMAFLRKVGMRATQ